MRAHNLILFAAVMLLAATAVRIDNEGGSARAADGQPPSSAVLSAAGSATPPPAATPLPAAATPPHGGEDTAMYDNDTDPVQGFILRAGAWAVQNSGSPVRVHQNDSPASSPFWDADGLYSNGNSTVDFTATGTDDEDNHGYLHYYGGPALEANVVYDRFPHELYANDFNGWNFNGMNNTAGPIPNTPANIVNYTQDNLTPGQNYVLEVQKFNAKFQGRIADNLKWRVDVFGLDKEGFREANVLTYGADYQGAGSTGPGGSSLAGTDLATLTHMTTQAQHIDWQTIEVTPSLEWRLDCNTVMEYSHLIRCFTANDEPVTYNYYTTDPSLSLNPTANAAAGTASQIAMLRAGYDIVPDSQTQIDRLKFSTLIAGNTNVYLLGYNGYNEDLLRTTFRNFNGVDLRVTNRPTDRLTLTAYGKYYREDSTVPLNPLSPTPPDPNDFYQEPNSGGVEIAREIHTVGITSRWCPWQGECDTYRSRLSLTGGYEYSTLIREDAGDFITGSGQFIDPTTGFFSQPSSNKNSFTVGAEEKWSPQFDSFVRYKFTSIDYPLYGITPDISFSQDYALNSALPTQVNYVEIGNTWTPNDVLMINATVYVENSLSDAPYVNWQSNSVPFTVSGWWAAQPNWSFTFGAAEMDNWINQDVNFGTLADSRVSNALKVPWNFVGVADVINFGTRYQATDRLSFSGEFEYVRGINASYANVDPRNQVPSLGAGYPATPYDLGQYTEVKMQSFRLGAGFDYLIYPQVTCYFRYNYYDYQDISTGLLTGQTNMFLVGMSARY